MERRKHQSQSFKLEALEGRKLRSAEHIDVTIVLDQPPYHQESHEFGVLTPSGVTNSSTISTFSSYETETTPYVYEATDSARHHFAPASASVSQSTFSSSYLTTGPGDDLYSVKDSRGLDVITPNGALHSISSVTTQDTFNGITTDSSASGVHHVAADDDTVDAFRTVVTTTVDGQTTGERTNTVFVTQNGEVRVDRTTVRSIE